MNDRLYNTLLLGGLVIAGVYVVKRFAVSPTVTTALNPTDPGNIANQGFNAVYSAITGSSQPLGADIYDATHFAPFQDQGQSVYQVPPLY